MIKFLKLIIFIAILPVFNTLLANEKILSNVEPNKKLGITNSLNSKQTIVLDESLNNSSLYNKIKIDSIVKVQVKNKVGKEKQSVGSGVFVNDNGTIVTNFHVVSENFFNIENNTIFISIGRDPREFEAEIIYVDYINDLSLLKIKSSELTLNNLIFSTVKFSVKSPNIGEKLFSIGFPNNWNLTIVDGSLNGIMEKRLVKNYLVSYALTHGMSGGPTFNEEGELVAINVATYDNLSFIIPLESVKKIINDSNKFKVNPSISYKDRLSLLRSISFSKYQDFIAQQINIFTKNTSVLKIGSLDFPVKNNLLECWSKQLENQSSFDIDKKNENDIKQTYFDCYTQDSISIQSNLSLGGVSFSIEHFEEVNSAPIYFWQLIEKKYNNLINKMTESNGFKSGSNCQLFDIYKNNVKKMYLCTTEISSGGIKNNKIYKLQVVVAYYKKNSVNKNEAALLAIQWKGINEKQIKYYLNFLIYGAK